MKRVTVLILALFDCFAATVQAENFELSNDEFLAVESMTAPGEPRLIESFEGTEDPHKGKWHCYCWVLNRSGYYVAWDAGYGNSDQSGKSCKALGKEGTYSCHKH